MNTGWDFFDARGNQGHMYAYFRFFARDLVLFYPSPRGPLFIIEETVVSTIGDGSISRKVWAAFPAPSSARRRRRRSRTTTSRATKSPGRSMIRPMQNSRSGTRRWARPASIRRSFLLVMCC